MRNSGKVILVLLLTLCLAACAGGNKHRLHHTVLDKPDDVLPKTLAILPSVVTVNELSAGGIAEEVPAWSEQAKKNLQSQLKAHFNNDSGILKVVDLPELDEQERKVLDQYMALYEVVGGSAYEMSRSNEEAWSHKSNHFDYSLGDGLRFLKEKSGADAGIIFTAVDFVPTDERKAMAVVAAALGIYMYMGNPFIFAGIVDFDTGNILWLNFDIKDGYSDLRDEKDVKFMLRDLFKLYPGIEKYKVAGK